MRLIKVVSTKYYNSAYVEAHLTKRGFKIWNHENLGPEAEVILAIGGDSAVLKASRYNLPILAWNQGHLGYLTTGKNLEEILNAYLFGDTFVDSRRKLEVDVDSKKYYVLNEVAVVGKETGRLVETDITIDDRYITTIKGDGLIVSTPTGSTAWNMSAGGSLVEHGVSCILLTPSNPFTMNARPLIINSTHTIVLSKVLKLVLDGHDIIEPKKSEITVRYDNHPVVIFRLKEENFFDGLEKLGWNDNIKK